jgi:hypothetical protein
MPCQIRACVTRALATTAVEEEDAEEEQLKPFHKLLKGSAGASEVSNSEV